LFRLPHFDLRLGLNPHAGAAGKRLVWRVANHARPVDPHLMAVLVVLVRLHRQDRVPLAGLVVVLDYVLVNVDVVFHGYECTLLVTGCRPSRYRRHDPKLAKNAYGVFGAGEHDVVAGDLVAIAAGITGDFV